jgi:BirA family biotin operon repressor/biotin-[acetyl-CoA-carboxylase] ligase
MPDVDLDFILRHTFVASAEYHPTLGSTNDRARECVADGVDELPRLILAGGQSAGRGRGTNRWWTGPGSLAFSLLLPAQQSAAAVGRRSSLVALATGVAVAESLAVFLPGRTVGIHWPNDVMADDRKLSGILIELLPSGHTILGIGVNTNNTVADAPPELRGVLGTLRDMTGQTYDSTRILAPMIDHIQRQLVVLATAPEETAARWDALCLQRGKILCVQQGNETLRGRCQGIAPDGALRLAMPCGERLIYSGTVEKWV